MKRRQVYEIIDRERDFQEKQGFRYRHSESDKGVPAEMVMMRVYMENAFIDWTYNYGDEAALHQIRKVVALGVRCLENHGCPERNERGR